MNTVTVYACPSVPMDSIECTIEYSMTLLWSKPFCIRPTADRSGPTMARSVTKRYCDGGAPH